MRTIKFRAWSGLMWLDGNDANIHFKNPDSTDIELIASYPHSKNILCQFTSLLDKNGKEIYEGDIVETEFGNFEVYFRDEFAGWYIKKSDGHIEFLNGMLGNQHTNEVIGNIYENPELLSPVI